MDEQVRAELTDLLRTGGRNLCTMPRMIGVLLRERCPDASQSVADLEQALRLGCVGPILDAIGAIDVEPLAGRLTEQTGMPMDRARWVVETWVHAIGAADSPPPVARVWAAWNRLDVTSTTAGGTDGYERAIVHLVVAALAGAVGGATLGIERLMDSNAALAIHDDLQDMPPWLQITSLIALGILGGGAGGLLGWILVGGRSWIHDAQGGTTLGRLVLASLGGCAGAAIGAFGGLTTLGLIGVMVGSLFGGLIGAVFGLLVAEGIYRFWW
jgi:hypothetical protein